MMISMMTIMMIIMMMTMTTTTHLDSDGDIIVGFRFDSFIDIGPVTAAFDCPSLDASSRHDDANRLRLPHHPPKITERLGQGS